MPAQLPSSSQPSPCCEAAVLLPGLCTRSSFPASGSSCTKLAQSPACFLPPLQAALLKLHPSHPSSLAVSPKYRDSKFYPGLATGDSCFHSTPHQGWGKAGCTPGISDSDCPGPLSIFLNLNPLSRSPASLKKLHIQILLRVDSQNMFMLILCCGQTHT